MHWIRPHVSLAPFPGRFAGVRLVDPADAGRESVERFIADVYLHRYGARLRSFLPHLLAYEDSAGSLVAAVGLRSGREGELFVEQYLDAPIEWAMPLRGITRAVDRRAVVEVGNFAATTPGIARELIVQLAHLLHEARMDWVLFVATQQLRNAFQRLHLSTVELAEARADHLRELCSDWGDYYASRPRLMCGNVAEGMALLRDAAAHPAPCAAPVLCLADAP